MENIISLNDFCGIVTGESKYRVEGCVRKYAGSKHALEEVQRAEY